MKSGRFSLRMLVFTVMLAVLGIFTSSASAYGDPTLTLTPSFDEAGNLKLQIVWFAPNGSDYNSDYSTELSYKGIPTAGMIYPTMCGMTSVSSNHKTGEVSIDSKYLYPGTLNISGWFNGTQGRVSVEIAEEDIPAAPVLTAEKTDALIGEYYNLYGEVMEYIEYPADCLLLRTDPDNKTYVPGWNSTNETSVIFSDGFTSLPSECSGNEAAYTYQLRYRDKTSGKWSYFSDPVTVTVRRLGVLPVPEFENGLPTSIPQGGAGMDLHIADPQEGVEYKLSISSAYVITEQINETSWHVTALDQGTLFGSIEASRPGYESALQRFTITMTEPQEAIPAAPEVTWTQDETDAHLCHFQINAEGITELMCITWKREIIPYQSGDLITFSYPYYGQQNVTFFAKINGTWSEKRALQIILQDPSKLKEPVVTVETDENNHVTAGNDVIVHLQHVRNAARYELVTRTQAMDYANPYSYYSLDYHQVSVEATGEDLLVTLPENAFVYREDTADTHYSNYYTLVVTAYPEEGSELQTSQCQVSFGVDQPVLPETPNPDVIDLLILGQDTRGHTDRYNTEYFEFVPEEDGFYVLKENTSGPEITCSGILYDGQWNEVITRSSYTVKESYGTRTHNMHLAAFLKQDQHYYFSVKSTVNINPNASSEGFSVRLNRITLSELTEGQEEYASSYPDSAYFSFSPIESGSYTFYAVSSVPGYEDPKRITIYDTAAQIVAETESAGEDEVSLDGELTAGETYVIEIQGRGENILILPTGAEQPPTKLSAELQVEGELVTGNSLAVRINAQGGSGTYRFGLDVLLQKEDGRSETIWQREVGRRIETNEWTFPLHEPGTYTLTAIVWDNETTASVEIINDYTVTGTDYVQQEVQQLADTFMSQHSGEYERALAAHDWLIGNAEYDHEEVWCGAGGVLLAGKGGCDSFASAYKQLITAMGMEAYFVPGKNGAMDHSWNQVRIEGEWYAVDVSWDRKGQYATDETGNTYLQPTHQYCFLNDSLFDVYHIKDQGASYPACTSLRSNYYIRSGFAREHWISRFSDDVNDALDRWELSFEIPANYVLPLENGIEVADYQWSLVEYMLNNEIWEHDQISYHLQASYQNETLSIQAEPVIDEELVMTLPESLVSIESEAFVGLNPGTVIRLPASVASIAPDAFDAHVILLCEEESPAYEICRNLGFRVLAR